MNWSHWIRSRWPELAGGKKVLVPHWLPHPSRVGFRKLRFATPRGQCANWGRSLTDGSRIHLHEFEDGRLVAHRDQYDPTAGLPNLLAHLLAETAVGPMVAVVGTMVLVNAVSES